jgi:hypothetical protein
MRSTRLKQLSARGIHTKGYPPRVLKCPSTSSLYGMYRYPLQTNSTEDERNASCSILITLVPPESMDERNLRSTFPRTLPMNVYSCTAPHRTAPHRTAPPLRRLQLLSARDARNVPVGRFGPFCRVLRALAAGKIHWYFKRFGTVVKVTLKSRDAALVSFKLPAEARSHPSDYCTKRARTIHSPRARATRRVYRSCMPNQPPTYPPSLRCSRSH